MEWMTTTGQTGWALRALLMIPLLLSFSHHIVSIITFIIYTVTLSFPEWLS